MKTSEILEKAAQKQAEHGHCSGSWLTSDGQVCLQGAIQLAAGGRTVFCKSPLYDEHGIIKEMVDASAIFGFDREAYYEADNVVKELIARDDLLNLKERMRTPGDPLYNHPQWTEDNLDELYRLFPTYDYNDQDDTTSEDVILLLKRAAEYAREKEEAENEEALQVEETEEG